LRTRNVPQMGTEGLLLCPVGITGLINVHAAEGNSPELDNASALFWISGNRRSDIHLLSSFRNKQDVARLYEFGTTQVNGVTWHIMLHPSFSNISSFRMTILLSHRESSSDLTEYLSREEYERVGTYFNAIGWNGVNPKTDEIDDLDMRGLNLPNRDGTSNIFTRLSEALRHLNERANSLVPNVVAATNALYFTSDFHTESGFESNRIARFENRGESFSTTVLFSTQQNPEDIDFPFVINETWLTEAYNFSPPNLPIRLKSGGVRAQLQFSTPITAPLVTSFSVKILLEVISFGGSVRHTIVLTGDASRTSSLAVANAVIDGVNESEYVMGNRDRIRMRIFGAGENLTRAGLTFGSNITNSYVLLPAQIDTNAVLNRSRISGDTATQVLNSLSSVPNRQNPESEKGFVYVSDGLGGYEKWLHKNEIRQTVSSHAKYMLLSSTNGTHPAYLPTGMLSTEFDNILFGMYSMYDTAGYGLHVTYAGEDKKGNTKLTVAFRIASLFGPVANQDFQVTFRIFRNNEEIYAVPITIDIGPKRGYGEAGLNFGIKNGDQFYVEIPKHVLSSTWITGTQHAAWKIELFERISDGREDENDGPKYFAQKYNASFIRSQSGTGDFPMNVLPRRKSDRFTGEQADLLNLYTGLGFTHFTCLGVFNSFNENSGPGYPQGFPFRTTIPQTEQLEMSRSTAASMAVSPISVPNPRFVMISSSQSFGEAGLSRDVFALTTQSLPQFSTQGFTFNNTIKIEVRLLYIDPSQFGMSSNVIAEFDETLPLSMQPNLAWMKTTESNEEGIYLLSKQALTELPLLIELTRN